MKLRKLKNYSLYFIFPLCHHSNYKINVGDFIAVDNVNNTVYTPENDY